MLVSASQAAKENTLVKHVTRAAKSMLPFIKKSIFETIIFLTLIALIYNASIWMQAMQIIMIIPILTIIYITLLSSKTLEAVQC